MKLRTHGITVLILWTSVSLPLAAQATGWDFSFSSIPRDGGNLTLAEAAWPWGNDSGGSIRYRWESLQYGVEFADTLDSLGLAYEESRRVDLVPWEGRWGNLGVSFGVGYSADGSELKGYYREDPALGGFPFISLMETRNRTFITPRAGLAWKQRGGEFPWRLNLFVAPWFFITAQEYFLYEGSDPATEYWEYFSDSQGSGLPEVEASGAMDLFGWLRLEGNALYRSYALLEYQFNADGSGDEFSAAWRRWQTLSWNAGVSFLLPWSWTKGARIGAGYSQKWEAEASTGLRRAEGNWALILGFNP